MASNELRQRAGKTPAKSSANSPPLTSKASSDNAFSIIDVLRILGGVALLSAVLSYFVTSGESLVWKQRLPWWTKPRQVEQYMVRPTSSASSPSALSTSSESATSVNSSPTSSPSAQKGPLKITLEELKQYDGTDPEKPIYIAVNRTIYDVTASPQTYGPGGAYHVLTGKDASRAYITGCMDTDLIPDLRGVEEMYVALWLSRHPEPEEFETMKAAQESMEKSNGKMAKEFLGKTPQEMIDTVKKMIGTEKVDEMQKKAYEAAHEECRAVIDNWKRMFDGSMGKEYFEVGRVVGEDGEELTDESFGPRPKLCKLARDKRPKMMDGSGGGKKGKAAGKDQKTKLKGALPTDKVEDEE